MPRQQKYWDADLNAYVVVTWEDDSSNRYESEAMDERTARNLARSKRNEDQHLHSVAVQRKNRGLFGRR